MGCPTLRFSKGTDEAAEYAKLFGAEQAFNQQMGVRSSPNCDPAEWDGRCQQYATMLLLAGKHGTCHAAGCVHVQGSEESLVVEVRRIYSLSPIWGKIASLEKQQ